MLSGIHVLLTYACTFECDHCFLYCSPWAAGTFSLDQIKTLLDQAGQIDSVETVFFEGGEALLYYSLLLKSVGMAKQAGFKVGLVTNAYPATSGPDAELWLKPLAEAGLDFLSVSNDSFHYRDREKSPARIALETALKLNISADCIAVADPGSKSGGGNESGKGRPIEGGPAMFRGRAADKLVSGLDRKDWRTLDKCPYEDLVSPSRVHVDAYGYVHLCQGLTMGNLWETPLPLLLARYDPQNHPVCAALVKGGPALLAEQEKIEPEPGYVDECHFCFLLRRQLLDKYPGYLAPKQVYGPGCED